MSVLLELLRGLAKAFNRAVRDVNGPKRKHKGQVQPLFPLIVLVGLFLFVAFTELMSCILTAITIVGVSYMFLGDFSEAKK
jgi:hypothetical protein